MGSSPERGKKGKEEGRGGTARGGMGATWGCHGEGLQALFPARAASYM
jgi:hypothetical protein